MKECNVGLEPTRVCFTDKLCETYGHYCGIMGYTWIEDGEIVEDSEITIFHNGEEVNPTVIKVWEFSPIHDFEHG